MALRAAIPRRRIGCSGVLHKPNSVVPVTWRCESFLWDRRCRRPLATYPETVSPDHPEMASRKQDGRPASRLPIWSCSAWGLPCLDPSPVERCALTAPFHPYLSQSGQAVCSLWHFPSRHRASPLASMLPVGVRTFLPRLRLGAQGDRLEHSGAASILPRTLQKTPRCIEVYWPQPSRPHVFRPRIEWMICEKLFFSFFFFGPDLRRSNASRAAMTSGPLSRAA